MECFFLKVTVAGFLFYFRFHLLCLEAFLSGKFWFCAPNYNRWALVLHCGGCWLGNPWYQWLGFSSWASQVPQGNLGHIPAFEGLGCIYWFKIWGWGFTGDVCVCVVGVDWPVCSPTDCAPHCSGFSASLMYPTSSWFGIPVLCLNLLMRWRRLVPE